MIDRRRFALVLTLALAFLVPALAQPQQPQRVYHIEGRQVTSVLTWEKLQ